MGEIKDAFEYMADLDGLKECLPCSERPTPRVRHEQGLRFTLTDESDRTRMARSIRFKKSGFRFYV